MNKKFSTLVASLLLATTVGTVSAATEKGVVSSYPRQVAESIDGKFYQLSDGYNVLAMEQKTDGSFILKFVPYGEAELAKTLWEIRSLDNKDEKGLSFQFYNVSTGLPISFDSKLATKFGSTLTATPLSQGVSSWSWVRGVEGDPLLTPTALESFFSAEKDSVITLMNTANGVAAVKYATKDQASVTGDIQVKPMEASPVYLNAYDLNTMLQTGKSKLHLNFNPNVSTYAKANEFTGTEGDREFTVKDAVGQNSLSLSLVSDAQADVDAKKAAEETALKNLKEAVEEIKNLDANKYEATQEFDAAKQAHQDALDEKTQKEIEWNKADELISTYIQQRDGNLSYYKSLIQTNEEERIKLNESELEKNNASEKWESAKTTLVTEKALNDQYEAEKNIAYSEAQVAYSNQNVAKVTRDNLNAILQNAKGVNQTPTEFIGTLDSNDSYVALQKNAPDAAEQMLKFLNGFNRLTQLTDQFIETFMMSYDNTYEQLLAEYKDLNVAYQSANSKWKTQNQKYNDARIAAKDAEDNYIIAEKQYQADLEKFNGTSTEADRIWNEVLVYVQLISEQQNIKDSAWKRLTELDSEIDKLWEEVLEKGEIYASITTDYGTCEQKISELNLAYHIAWYQWNDAVKYLASLDGKDANWYSLQYSDGSYLMVDTAYLESNASVKHQTFALKKFESAEVKYPGIEKMTARDINGRFNFRFLYYPTVDSLVITADGGNDLPAGNRYWRDYRPVYDMEGRNYVKLAVLGNGTNEHREVTLGAPYDVYTGNAAPQMTLNTRINLSLLMNTPGKNIPAGVYFADVVDEKTLEPLSRIMLDLAGNFTKVATAEWNVMEFGHMPAAKWVVKENSIYSGSPAILNQESGKALNDTYYRVLDVKEDGSVILYLIHYDYQGGRSDETVKLTPVTEENDYGYIHKGFSANTDSIFTFGYLNVTGGLSVQIGTANDTILRVAQGEGTQFVLENATKDAIKYGVNVDADNTFEKRPYYIRVNDANKLDNNYKYVTVSDVDGTELMVVSTKDKRVPFFLKEINHTDSTHYFALVTADNQFKAGVIDATGLIKAENVMDETTTSAFSLSFNTTEYYRTFTADELAKSMKFYRTVDHAYLYADKGLLEFENKQTEAGDLANLQVIPAVTEGTIMPQYLVGKITKVVEGDTIWCNATASHKHETLADSLACPHTTIIKDTTFVNFMTNLKIDAKLDKANLFENRYSRVGFLDGYITDGKLYWTVEGKEYNVALNENKHHPAKFQFRLVEEGSNDFLIESESWGYDKDKNYLPFEGGVRPFENGGWLKIQNAVPVIVRTNYEDAVASGETFNVEAGSDITANETIAAGNVVVAGTNGAVVVKGAEGKNVIVSTILGKVVANEVVSSDNAQIATPAGIVVVSVDGESFKVVVK